jgi:rhamnulokinase
MDLPANGRALVAIDLGAQSCRVSLLRWRDRQPSWSLVYRVANAPIESSRGLTWDMQAILKSIEEGLQRCAQEAPEGIAAIGVDGWAVDYVRLLEDGSWLGDPFCYRDVRTVSAEAALSKIISAQRLFELTGVQPLRINTLFQLFADNSRGISPKTPWMNLPEAILVRLGGDRIAEYTNATHTQLLGLQTREWCPEIFTAAGQSCEAAPRVVPPGTIVGTLKGQLAENPRLRGAKLIAPACHDTASAVAGSPFPGEDRVFISSGTWSLVGIVLEEPVVAEEARLAGFTNIGGLDGRYCFLRNVNGMWLLGQCQEEWKIAGKYWDTTELISACHSLASPPSCVDVDADDLSTPGPMLARLNRQILEQGGSPLSDRPEAAPQIANLLFHSLAEKYARVLRDIRRFTGKDFRQVCVVGGGSRNRYLNQLTEEKTGVAIVPGPAESSTVGNFAIQLACLEGKQGLYGVKIDAVARWANLLNGAMAQQLNTVA